MTRAISCYFLCITLLHLRVTLPRRSVFIFFCICIEDVNLNFPTKKITTCKCLECKRMAETFGHQNT
ncbi:hypothetical protein NQ318_018400 [Aromia moschata]|uniref:Secreted protein n=1 Tax=Aromia moschata TaxID=1265417 RepID=A0AAV8XUB2_9CUCU|nr:hypothetical protein NQ318_018400 [Aromia moschata]